MRGDAEFDPTGAYRYRLWREWDSSLPQVTFVMLNPSIADAQRNDPTIRRCIGYAQRWGFGSMEAVNLFSYRSTDPTRLRQVEDPVGPGTDAATLRAAERAERVVVAWGNHGSLLNRGPAMIGLLSARWELHCLGVTGFGHPRHPLHLAYAVPLERFSL